MDSSRPRGHYKGPLSFKWCAYSNTLRAMPMNYLVADLSRIDASLWGREGEIGSMLAEASAMLEALRDLLPLVPTINRPAPDPEWRKIRSARAILARIEKRASYEQS